jgi:hypothetical protein
MQVVKGDRLYTARAIGHYDIQINEYTVMSVDPKQIVIKPSDKAHFAQVSGETHTPAGLALLNSTTPIEAVTKELARLERMFVVHRKAMGGNICMAELHTLPRRKEECRYEARYQRGCMLSVRRDIKMLRRWLKANG